MSQEKLIVCFKPTKNSKLTDPISVARIWRKCKWTISGQKI